MTKLKLWPSAFRLQGVRSLYLVVLLQDVVHLGHIFTCDGLDDVSPVAGRVEASAAPRLRVVGQGRAPGQGILPRRKEGRETVSHVASRVLVTALLTASFQTHLEGSSQQEGNTSCTAEPNGTILDSDSRVLPEGEF